MASLARNREVDEALVKEKVNKGGQQQGRKRKNGRENWKDRRRVSAGGRGREWGKGDRDDTIKEGEQSCKKSDSGREKEEM